MQEVFALIFAAFRRINWEYCHLYVSSRGKRIHEFGIFFLYKTQKKQFEKTKIISLSNYVQAQRLRAASVICSVESR